MIVGKEDKTKDETTKEKGAQRQGRGKKKGREHEMRCP